MKIIYNDFIPFKGMFAINLFGVLFIHDRDKNTIITNNILNHEKIHNAQMKELGYIFFYLLYFIEWIIRVIIAIIKCKPIIHAYYNISFEQEAYNNSHDFDYLKTRKHYSFVKYLTTNYI